MSTEISLTSSSIWKTSFPVSLFFKGDPENKFSKFFGKMTSDGSFAERGNRLRRQIGSSQNNTALCAGGMDLETAYLMCSEPKSKCKTFSTCIKSARCGRARRRRWTFLPIGFFDWPPSRGSGCWDEHTITRVTDCCEYICEDVGSPNNRTEGIFERL